MAFNQKIAEELVAGYNDVLSELTSEIQEIIRFSQSLKEEKAREYATHGLARRLGVCRRCIENVYRIFPPNRTDILSHDENYDLTINLHAFVINIAGALDCIAWLYVHEKKITISRMNVDIFKPAFQKQFSKEICDYLTSARLTDWHDQWHKDYRDSLAHRISLYIPPYVISPEDAEEFKNLERQVIEYFDDCMAGEEYSHEKYATLRENQDKLKKNSIAIYQSVSSDEPSPPVLFHSQIIADARTVLEIYAKVRGELPSK